MDNGASGYRRFLQGDEKGFEEIVRIYKDGLILYLNGYVNNLYTAEELTEETFFRLLTKRIIKITEGGHRILVTCNFRTVCSA